MLLLCASIVLVETFMSQGSSLQLPMYLGVFPQEGLKDRNFVLFIIVSQVSSKGSGA